MTCYIWNPYVQSQKQNIIDFVLTSQEDNSIAKGSKGFFKTLLQDMGINRRIISWSIVTCRSKYYTDFIDEDDWRDNWQLVWKISVVTDNDMYSLEDIQEPYIESEAYDNTWSLDTRIRDDDSVNCLIVADFDLKKNIQYVQKLINNNNQVKSMRHKYLTGKILFDRSNILGEYQQLKINLGKFPGQFFANGADYAEIVMELCKDLGGIVNYQEHL